MTAIGNPSLMDHLGESIEYKSADGLPEGIQTWKVINAIVNRGAERRGASADYGREPIEVFVESKDIPEIHLQRDRIRLDGEDTYRVCEKTESPGGWYLYCA